ncbi:MAG: 30S ribosomal protein S20 [Candidatus Zixiibacteriota bacterium]|nr:MAG: 30S ribosomal protein S20 [candidate division Zixibacteria bacterium]
MPHHKSCKKRMKTSEQQRLRNRTYRSQLRTSIRELRSMTAKDEAVAKYNSVMSLLDKAVAYGLIHKKNADRNKARLARFVQQLG